MYQHHVNVAHLTSLRSVTLFFWRMSFPISTIRFTAYNNKNISSFLSKSLLMNNFSKKHRLLLFIYFIYYIIRYHEFATSSSSQNDFAMPWQWNCLSGLKLKTEICSGITFYTCTSNKRLNLTQRHMWFLQWFTVPNMFRWYNQVMVGGSRFDVPETWDLLILKQR